MPVDDALFYLMPIVREKPTIFIVYSNALGEFPNILRNATRIGCEEIPNYPACANSKNFLIYGKWKDVPVLALQGRLHIFEGLSMDQLKFPVRLAYHLGCENMFITNASGSINAKYQLGDLIIIKDHIYLFSNFNNTPPRYDKEFVRVAKRLAVEKKIEDRVHEGVYAMLGGSSFKSTAEAQALKSLGADAVGMSSIPEMLTAFYYDMSVFGISVVTDKGIFDSLQHPEPTPEEIYRAVKSKKEYIKHLMIKYIEHKAPCRDGRTVKFKQFVNKRVL